MSFSGAVYSFYTVVGGPLTFQSIGSLPCSVVADAVF